MRINRLMLFMLLLGYCHIGCGQEQVLVDTLNVQVYFPLIPQHFDLN